MASFKLWVAGARPRTLVAAAVPVAVGAALVAGRHSGAAGLAHDLNADQWIRAFLALLVSVSLQVGVNYANDYSDGVAGRDKDRTGPLRLTASGSAPPRQVAFAAALSIAVAGICGLALAAMIGQWWILIVGALAGIAAAGYSGGPKPYASLGFGEPFVFIFFGIVATVGSAYVVSSGSLSWVEALLASIPVGMLAVAILQANNLRDIEGDRRENKLTLAVRMGRRRAGLAYVGVLFCAAAGVVLVSIYRPWVLLALLSSLLVRKSISLALSPSTGRDLLPLLGSTALLEMLAGLLIVVGLLI
jgi:1,4-dihydroxy-2-naphthoate octaprenyltransferase